MLPALNQTDFRTAGTVLTFPNWTALSRVSTYMTSQVYKCNIVRLQSQGDKRWEW